MELESYKLAWENLIKVLQEKTSWGRNDLKTKMGVILMESEIEVLKNKSKPYFKANER